MTTDENHSPAPSFFSRLWQALGPASLPSDDRGRMRMVVDNLVLHLHPAKVPERTLSWTYTWGLGGLVGPAGDVLALTGIFLEMNYTPSPPQAYLDILALRTNTWFGDLLRNLHHWSANLLVVAAVLHLLRVFFTGGHRPPARDELDGRACSCCCWCWAPTSPATCCPGTSWLSGPSRSAPASSLTCPWLATALSRLLLGGPEVGAATLLNFYSLHISFIPISIVMLMSFTSGECAKMAG